jgi:hypothetical protein
VLRGHKEDVGLVDEVTVAQAPWKHQLDVEKMGHDLNQEEIDLEQELHGNSEGQEMEGQCQSFLQSQFERFLHQRFHRFLLQASFTFLQFDLKQFVTYKYPEMGPNTMVSSRMQASNVYHGLTAYSVTTDSAAVMSIVKG